MDVSTAFKGTSCYTGTNNPANAALFVQRSTPDHGLLRELELLHARFGQTAVAIIIMALPHGVKTLSKKLLGILRMHMLSCDSLVSLNEGRYAILLPGAGVFKAQAIVEDMLRKAPDLALGIGIAAGTDHGDQKPELLLEQADLALHQALDTGAHIHIYREPAAVSQQRKTLVQSDEKRFLFSGGY